MNSQIHIRFRFSIPKSRLIKNNNVHIAQGLNPSNAPRTTARTGREKSFTPIAPKNGTFIFSGISVLPSSPQLPLFGAAVSSGSMIGAATSRQPCSTAVATAASIAAPVEARSYQPIKYLSPITVNGTPETSTFKSFPNSPKMRRFSAFPHTSKSFSKIQDDLRRSAKNSFSCSQCGHPCPQKKSTLPVCPKTATGR